MKKKRVGQKVKRNKKIRGKKVKNVKRRPLRVKKMQAKRSPQHIRGKKP